MSFFIKELRNIAKVANIRMNIEYDKYAITKCPIILCNSSKYSLCKKHSLIHCSHTECEMCNHNQNEHKYNESMKCKRIKCGCTRKVCKTHCLEHCGYEMCTFCNHPIVEI